MAMLVRGAVAAVAAVGVSSGTTKQVHPSSNGVLACRGSAFCRGASGRLSWASYQVRERRAALRVTNVAAPVKEQEASTETVASKENARPVFPFTAIVGQEEMKMCLILNVIDPKIGGVMIMGDRGTGKSTTVRALVDLLPEIEVVSGDPFNSSPSDPELMSEEVRKRVQAKEKLPVSTSRINMVDLPLGATEDRVCGTIDIEKALTEGVKAFEPGLLAKANRGILYVDEVNLLDDHLVDVLLDSAASGWNTVEREGISISHPARFILIGSGNPEEGELRPQLLDRFGMHAQVGTVKDAELRVKIVEERGMFDANPKTFRVNYDVSQKELRDQIDNARALLSSVKVPHDLRVKISQVCSELDVDGLRGDIVSNRAAKALAAFRGRNEVTPEDIGTVMPNCLRHRLRKDPLESIDSGTLVIDKFNEVFGYSA
ncbi:hypothetical protein M758_2G152500 [Ceratodon purpureus]|nr:hypothetical protein M758_2G152500 [Ceratodon purpureus]